MKPNYHIRNYSKNDFKSVLTLFQLNTPKYFAKEEENDLIYYLTNELEEYFVIEYQNSIVGCGGINFKGHSGEAYISWDMIHPGHHGVGLGSKLLQYRLNKLKALSSINTVVVRTSQHTYLFYQKNGFVLREIVKDYWAPEFDLYKMELKLF